MGVSQTVYLLVGTDIDQATHDKWYYHEEYPDEYDDAAPLEDRKKLYDDGIRVISDMDGHSKLGKILLESQDGRWDPIDFDMTLDPADLIDDVKAVQKRLWSVGIDGTARIRLFMNYT